MDLKSYLQSILWLTTDTDILKTTVSTDDDGLWTCIHLRRHQFCDTFC